MALRKEVIVVFEVSKRNPVGRRCSQISEERQKCFRVERSVGYHCKKEILDHTSLPDTSVLQIPSQMVVVVYSLMAL